jgi:hypothetical protein
MKKNHSSNHQGKEIKITGRYYFIPVRIDVIKNKN